MRIDFIKHNILISTRPAGSFSVAKKEVQADSAPQNVFMNELSVMQNYNMPFLGKTTARPVYAIDREMKETWFASASRAGAALGVPTPSILKCLAEDESKRAKYAGDYCFVLASNVEMVKEDGSIDIDKEKIRQIFETAEVARVEGANVKKRRFYGMNGDHLPVLFLSYSEAEKATSATRPNIIRCLKGDSKTAGGYIFFNPEEIEIVDSSGKVNYDEEKLDALIKRADECLENSCVGEKLPLYALYIGDEEDKKDIRFDTITEAINKLKISHQSISACLSGNSEFAGDYCFIRAAGVETIKEDGSVDVDNDKIAELKKKAKIARDDNTCARGKAVFALKIEDNSLRRYDTSAVAAQMLTISPANISTCLAGRKKSTNGYIFIPAYKIEVKDENGTLKPDEEKLKTALKELDESVAAYKAKKAAEKPKVIKPKVKKAKADKANKVENADKAKTKTKRAKDPTKLQRKYTQLGRIYGYKSNGDTVEYKDLFTASKELDTDLETLYKIIKNNLKGPNGLVFATDADYK